MKLTPEENAALDEQIIERETPGLVVRCASHIEPENIEFLWSGRLARGKHTAIAGDPGDGKSQVSIYMAAMITTGGEWPCGEGRAPVGNVLFLSAEDGAADTIIPRLIAAGADRSRVYIVNAVKGDKGRRAFNLQADLALLEQKIAEIGDVALVIIDPISSYLGKTDSHKNSEVRGVLEPLSEMAERLRVAVLSITHFSKGGVGNTTKALHRFIGSIAFTGAPRAAFAVVADPDEQGRMLFLHGKNNMAPKPQGLAYRLLQTILPDKGIVTSYVCWDRSPVAISADEAMASGSDSKGGTMKEDYIEFLQTVLADGPMQVKPDIEQEARDAGLLGDKEDISQSKPCRKAREVLGVTANKDGYQGKWMWRLPLYPGVSQPSKMPSNPKGALLFKGASLGLEGIFEQEQPSEAATTAPVMARAEIDDLEIPAFLDRRKNPLPASKGSA